MLHLDRVTLARLVDGPGDEAEAGHLEGCAECRAELEALREQTNSLGALSAPAAPARLWPVVEARLRAHVTPLHARRRSRAWVLRAAAAVTLFVAGATTGAWLDREPPVMAGGDETPELERSPAAEPEPEGTLREAEVLYAAALARYMAEGSDGDGGVDPTRRLAALESIILTARAALDEAPNDQVIGGYYRTALAQREALLSQVQYAESEVWF